VQPLNQALGVAKQLLIVLHIRRLVDTRCVKYRSHVRGLGFDGGAAKAALKSKVMCHILVSLYHGPAT
jgi:hypothetical protein